MSSSNSSESLTYCTDQPWRQGVFLLEGVLIFLANALTITVFWRRRFALKRASYLLINLAVADLLVGLIVTLFAFADMFCGQHTFYFLVVVGSFIVLGATASISSLAVIAVERAFAIAKPLKHRTASKKYYYGAICSAWSIAIAVTVCSWMYFLEFRYSRFITGSTLVACLITIFVLYYVAWRSSSLRRMPPAGLARLCDEQNRKVAKTLAVVTFLSLATLLPCQVYSLVAKGQEEFVQGTSLSVIIFLRYANSLLNPFVYVLRVPYFRQEIRELLSSISRRCKDRFTKDVIPIGNVTGRTAVEQPCGLSSGLEGSYKLRIVQEQIINEQHFQDIKPWQ